MSKSERTKQFIIEQSAPIINKKGVAGTSITDLMEATQLAKGGIYGNFESKEAISVEVLNYLVTRVGKGLDQAISTKTTAKDKLFAILDYHQSMVTSPMGGCPLLNFGTEADDTNPIIKQRVVKAIKSAQQRIHNVIEDGKKSGEFKSSVNASTFSLKMFAMIEGAIFTSRVTNNPAAMKTIIDLLKNEIQSM